MRIRKYRDEDRKKVIKMIEEVLIELFGHHVIKKWEDFGDYAIFYVVEDKGKIIGSIGLRDDGNGIGKLKRMYLYKEYRGKGLGQKLFDKLLNFAIKNKFKKIRLTTEIRLKSSIRFYKKNGFKEIKYPEIKKYFSELKNEGVNIKRIKFMEKNLK